ncbi:MAG: helicase-related protein [Thermoanaerobaculia bacterium]|jgi:superfamily II DNA or RNA helicase
MSYAIGSLVKARGREWVVLPESKDDLLVLRPLGGTDDEVTGILTPLEKVEPATFQLPDPAKLGDARSCRLLRDAVRLGFRASAGPFRSFGRIAVEPRPYQLVPLLMALKLDPVRILIADDVGIGKTVEAALIARELLDRGESDRLAVLCPPHLAEQWQTELREKFHIDAELVLPSTVTRLERGCGPGESLFDRHPFVIVSLDFIKADRRRESFLRACPDLVIVDEAHTCAAGIENRGSRHQRHQLIHALAEKPDRHLILVTATPHSGKDDAFQSLLGFLDKDLQKLPDELRGEESEPILRKVAAHFVQRRRADIRQYLGAETDFPTREETEVTYQLSKDYAKLFYRVLEYAREIVKDPTEQDKRRQRIRWWSALALLRALASSPAAAAATLRNRAASLEAETAEDADEIGRQAVLDLADDEATDATDVSPGADFDETTDSQARRRLQAMAREADALCGAKDEKLQRAVKMVKQLVDDGFNPIVFCRFIQTAEYVASELRAKLPKSVEIAAVTGTLQPDEREARVSALGESDKHVLVATDCLSEGVNLQDHFDAVVHYDLSWNPTRHEQREGRIDRYGQKAEKVRVVMYYGTDNQIDGVVLRVLLKKHKAIRNTLGISVPVPVDTDQVVKAIFESILIKHDDAPQQMLAGFEQHFRDEEKALFDEWERTADREKTSRTRFAQRTIKVAEVAAELESSRQAIGSSLDLSRFVRDAFSASGAIVTSNGSVRIDLREARRPLRDLIGDQPEIRARFELPIGAKETHLTRTHPVVEGLASWVVDSALDGIDDEAIAKRCGVVVTSKVQRRTTVLLLRYRFHVITRRAGIDQQMFAEESGFLGFAGAPQTAEWLPPETGEQLLDLPPEGNLAADRARDFVQKVVEGYDALLPHIHKAAKERAATVLDAHTRVRKAAQTRGLSHRVEPQLPVDLLGVYVYLPKN